MYITCIIYHVKFSFSGFIHVVLKNKIFKDPTPFLHFCDYLPFEDDLDLQLNKLEFPSHEDNFYQLWFNLACLLWRRSILKIFDVFLLFRYYLSLEKGYGEGLSPLFEKKIESPLSKNIFFQVWLELTQRFWRRF
jgi:hypothetical protein